MTLFQALVLGAVQGLTEFLPVSSTGHLILFPHFFGWEQQPLVFDTTLHLATALALIFYFWGDLVSVIWNFIQDFRKKHFDFSKFSPDGKTGLYILIGSIPAGVLGFLFDSVIENVFRSVIFVAIFLILGSFLMASAEFSLKNRKHGEDLDSKKSLILGFFQSLALLPGMSRSGSTISGGMFFGLRRDDAARFSFLLSIPVVIGAGLFKLLDFTPAVEGIYNAQLATGFISSFVFGILAIRFLLKYLKKNSLWVFIVYRLLLAAVIITAGFTASP